MLPKQYCTKLAIVEENVSLCFERKLFEVGLYKNCVDE